MDAASFVGEGHEVVFGRTQRPNRDSGDLAGVDILDAAAAERDLARGRENHRGAGEASACGARSRARGETKGEGTVVQSRTTPV